MKSIINAVGDTPLPNILVVAGILFLLLTVVNQFMGQITIAPDKQKLAGIIGALLLILGIALQVIPLQKVRAQITTQPTSTPTEPESKLTVPSEKPKNTAKPGEPMKEQQTTEQKYMEDTNLLWGDIGPAMGDKPDDCERACNSNAQCLAWTFVKQGALPGILRPGLSSFCALKNSKDLQKVHDPCCVSGYRQ